MKHGDVLTLSSASDGSYAMRVPKGLYRRLGTGSTSPFWWARVADGKKRATPFRWDGGSKVQSQRNLKLAVEWRQQCLSGGHAPAAPAAPVVTLNAMIATWLLGFPKDERRLKDETFRMVHWQRELGELPYDKVAPSTIKAAGARLVERGLLPSTVNRMYSSLQSCYRDSISETELNPVERVQRFRLAKRVPGGRAVTYELIAQILDAMPDLGESARGHGHRTHKNAIPRPRVNKTKLRLALIAYTGIPHQLITEINPKADVIWSTTPPQLRVRPRKKGGGTNERWVDLNPQAVAALKAFIEHDCMGDFSRSGAWNCWQRACASVRAEQTAKGEDPMGHVRPYDLRHSFITKMLTDSNGNLPGAQHNAIHSTPQQTMMYGAGAMPVEAKKVTAAWTMPVTKKPGRLLKIKRAR